MKSQSASILVVALSCLTASAVSRTPGINSPSYQLSGHPNTSLQKHDLYYADSKKYNANYDPLKVTASASVRPVVTISAPTCNGVNSATFTITRDVGSGSALADPLVVYYAEGGNLAYGEDFTLSPPPRVVDYPRIFSVQIPATQSSVDVIVSVTSSSIPPGENTVTVKLVSYGSAK